MARISAVIRGGFCGIGVRAVMDWTGMVGSGVGVVPSGRCCP
ncbi:hypothetical protein NSERUTF1_3236 [Nocardia seriolae]|nr:hypothetical protein NSERUTF1_3236 [Nocardia seriolae]